MTAAACASASVGSSREALMSDSTPPPCWTGRGVIRRCIRATRTAARQLQNIRLSSGGANPLNGNRKWRANGDGCVVVCTRCRSCARLKGVTVGRLETATRRGLSDRVLKPLHPSNGAGDGSLRSRRPVTLSRLAFRSNQARTDQLSGVRLVGDIANAGSDESVFTTASMTSSASFGVDFVWA
jgi:hypothetical protein